MRFCVAPAETAVFARGCSTATTRAAASVSCRPSRSCRTARRKSNGCADRLLDPHAHDRYGVERPGRRAVRPDDDVVQARSETRRPGIDGELVSAPLEPAAVEAGHVLARD